MKRKPGPTRKELRNTGVNTRYAARRFPGGPPKEKPPSSAKRKGTGGGRG